MPCTLSCARAHDSGWCEDLHSWPSQCAFPSFPPPLNSWSFVFVSPSPLAVPLVLKPTTAVCLPSFPPPCYPTINWHPTQHLQPCTQTKAILSSSPPSQLPKNSTSSDTAKPNTTWASERTTRTLTWPPLAVHKWKAFRIFFRTCSPTIPLRRTIKTTIGAFEEFCTEFSERCLPCSDLQELYNGEKVCDTGSYPKILESEFPGFSNFSFLQFNLSLSTLITVRE